MSEIKAGDDVIYFQPGPGGSAGSPRRRLKARVIKLANPRKLGGRTTIQWYDDKGTPHRKSVLPENLERIKDPEVWHEL